jgi:hypothetical protein
MRYARRRRRTLRHEKSPWHKGFAAGTTQANGARDKELCHGRQLQIRRKSRLDFDEQAVLVKPWRRCRSIAVVASGEPTSANSIAERVTKPSARAAPLRRIRLRNVFGPAIDVNVKHLRAPTDVVAS